MAIKFTNIFRSEALQNEPKLGFLVWKYIVLQPFELEQIERYWWKICIGSNICITKQVTPQVSVLIPFLQIKWIQEPILRLLNLDTFKVVANKFDFKKCGMLLAVL
jgi:hypothetical protein